MGSVYGRGSLRPARGDGAAACAAPQWPLKSSTRAAAYRRADLVAPAADMRRGGRSCATTAAACGPRAAAAKYGLTAAG